MSFTTSTKTKVKNWFQPKITQSLFVSSQLISFFQRLDVLFLLQGLEILAFPCNQFGEEEPGTTAQITEFVCTRFKSEFPIFNKVRPGIGYNLYVSMLNLSPLCVLD